MQIKLVNGWKSLGKSLALCAGFVLAGIACDTMSAWGNRSVALLDFAPVEITFGILTAGGVLFASWGLMVAIVANIDVVEAVQNE